MPIPWEKVILHGPQILDTARGLYGKWQTRAKADTIDPTAEVHVQLRELAQRLKAIEEGTEAQTGIIEKLAEQSQALSTGVSELKQKTAEFEGHSQNLTRIETSISEQLSSYALQLQDQERANESRSKKVALALYTAFASFGLAVAALVIALIR